MVNLKRDYEKDNGMDNTPHHEGLRHPFYVVVMAGCWIQICNGDWDFKIDKDRIGRAIDVEFITSVDKLKERVLEEYGLLRAHVTVDLSYWIPVGVSGVTGEREYPLQISTIDDLKIFKSFRIVSKLVSIFVTFRNKNEERTSAPVDVVSGKKKRGGGEDVLDDATLLMYVKEIEAVYSAKALELAAVDGNASEYHKTVDNNDGEVAEDDEEEEEEYDYNRWHDFVGRNCEWDDGKDEEGGAAGGQSGGRSSSGVRGEVMPGEAVGGKTADQSRCKGGGSSGKKHGIEELKAKSSFEAYEDDNRDYIVTSRNCVGVIDEDDFVEPSEAEVVFVTPPRETNQHMREVDDDDDVDDDVRDEDDGDVDDDDDDVDDDDDDDDDDVPEDDVVEDERGTYSGSSDPCKNSHAIPHLVDVDDDDDDEFVEDVPHVDVEEGVPHDDDDFVEDVTDTLK